MTVTEDFMKDLSAYLFKTGVFGKAVVSWAVWLNKKGYSIHMAFDGPAAYNYYLELLADFGKTDPYVQATSTTVIGLAFDLQQMDVQATEMYSGFPSLALYGGKGKFGI